MAPEEATSVTKGAPAPEEKAELLLPLLLGVVFGRLNGLVASFSGGGGRDRGDDDAAQPEEEAEETAAGNLC